MESNLLISTDKHVVQSSRQAETLQGEDSPNCPLLAEEQLVPHSTGVESESYSNPQPPTQPISTGEKCLRFIRENPSATLMDFLIVANQRPEINIIQAGRNG